MESELQLSAAILNDDNVSQVKGNTAVSNLQSVRNGSVEYTESVFRVNMYASMNSNNNVGNDWSYGLYYNGGYAMIDLKYLSAMHFSGYLKYGFPKMIVHRIVVYGSA